MAVGWRPEIRARAGSTRAVFGNVEPQCASAYFAPVELLDRFGRVLLSRESNECEAPGASAFAILWNVNVNDLADLSEERAKLFVCRAEIEVPYEYLA